MTSHISLNHIDHNHSLLCDLHSLLLSLCASQSLMLQWFDYQIETPGDPYTDTNTALRRGGSGGVINNNNNNSSSSISSISNRDSSRSSVTSAFHSLSSSIKAAVRAGTEAGARALASSRTFTMFEKSLDDLVKGIRNHKDNEAAFISECLQEIKKELKAADKDIKAQAVEKLIYLEMLGYDISWAAFSTVEVMSQPWFGHKRIGYLAASQSFTPSTDVILLTVHLFKKAFSIVASSASSNADSAEAQQYEIGCAINCLANICTPELATELLADISAMMNSTRPYVRKKAVLVLYKVFRQWPKALRLSFDRLKDKLADPELGVVSCAVNVICELARKNPANYLGLAPLFFKLLTQSNNNWMLIKVVKLMGALVPLEPRLAKKLADPLTNIITNTPAKSLLYESINTIISGNTGSIQTEAETQSQIPSSAIVKLCLEKLKTFIEDHDQNLKYLGLLGLHRLLLKEPRAVSEYKDTILHCLSDDDVSIRMRALDLITGMVSQRNLVGIVRRLQSHLEGCEGSYRDHVFSRIIDMCRQNNYAFIADFQWYTQTLVELSVHTGISPTNTQLLADQLLDVTVRVPDVRPYAVYSMVERKASEQATALILSERLLADTHNPMCQVLNSAAWIVGEFATHIAHKDSGRLITTMLQPRVNALPAHVQSVFVHSVLKVFSTSLLKHMDPSLQITKTHDAESDIIEMLADAESDDEKTSTADGQDKSGTGSGSEATQSSGVVEGGGAELAEPDSESQNELKAGSGKRQKETDELNAADGAGWQGKDHSSCIKQMCDSITTLMPLFTQSNYVEVQERAVVYLYFVQWLAPLLLGTANAAAVSLAADSSSSPSLTPEGPLDLIGAALGDSLSSSASSSVSSASSFVAIGSGSNQLLTEINSALVKQLAALFEDDLNPVNPKAQKKVPVPRGLDLDKWINEPVEDDDDNDRRLEGQSEYDLQFSEDPTSFGEGAGRKMSAKDKEAAEVARKKAELRRKNDPFYIGDGPGKSAADSTGPADKEGVKAGPAAGGTAGAGGGSSVMINKRGSMEDIPIKKLNADVSLTVESPTATDKNGGKKSKSTGDEGDDWNMKVDSSKQFRVNTVEEMPDDALSSDDDKKRGKGEKKGGKKGKDGKKSSSTAVHDDSDATLSDVDIITPLDPSEVIPRSVPYSQRTTVDTGGDKDSTGGRKHDGKKDKDKHGKHHKKERGHKKDDTDTHHRDKDKIEKEKDKDKDGKGRSKKEKDDKDGKKEKKDKGDNKDRGRGTKSSKDGGKDGKDLKSSKNKDGDKQSSGGSSGNGKTEDIFSASAAVAPVVADLLDFDPFAPQKESSAVKPSSGTKEKEKEKEKDDDKEKHHHHRKARKHSSSTSAPVAATSGLPSSAWSGDSVLCRDDAVAISYSCHASTSKPGSVAVSLSLRYTPNKNSRTLTEVVFVTEPGALPAGVKLKGGDKEKDGSVRVVLDDNGIKPTEEDSEPESLKLLVKVSAIPDPVLSLKGSVRYTQSGGSSGAAGKAVSLGCVLRIPGTAFVTPHKTTDDDLRETLADPVACTHLSSCKIAVVKYSVSAALELVSKICHVRLVEASNYTATYYGRSIELDSDAESAAVRRHVCVLVKAKPNDNNLSIDIKTSQAALASLLIQELQQIIS